MNRFPDTFQTVIDRCLCGQNVPHGVNTLTRWLTNSGCITQALSSSTHSSTVRQTIMSRPAITVRPECCWNDRRAATSFALDILAVDGDESPFKEWEVEDDVIESANGT